MPACRVFILTGHPLFAEGVETLLREQPGLEVVGAGDVSSGTLARI